ncbi:unnamed protein product [Protopolystoma xenopodis]|uniref:Uncharacterized protein n=1 Tax=Protopolystoma xenopodis TaxID=117903 RepID=A0A3S5A839_9PLAT|nr:unnamed protein product [Protopolystoma xenopodis]
MPASSDPLPEGHFGRGQTSNGVGKASCSDLFATHSSSPIGAPGQAGPCQHSRRLATQARQQEPARQKSKAETRPGLLEEVGSHRHRNTCKMPENQQTSEATSSPYQHVFNR